MPFLVRAEKLVLLAADDSGSREVFIRNFEDVTRQLRWHGLNVTPHVIPADEAPVPLAVMAAARHANADLFVMGGYGHSRLRELIFGGFTEQVLKGTDLPVLMMH
jgi:nucleotide-binding universal stress UspA family protein